MSGKPNTAWMETMITKHGSREAVKAWMQNLGSKGGKNGSTGGFACELRGSDGLTGPERASVKGKIGGRISRRTKAQ